MAFTFFSNRESSFFWIKSLDVLFLLRFHDWLFHQKLSMAAFLFRFVKRVFEFMV